MSILASLDSWRRILDPEFAPLLTELAAVPDGGLDPATIQRLRSAHARDDFAVAIELVAARRRAAARFRQPERLLCDLSGVEQASGSRVAAHKAQRFAARRGAAPIVDLCCGIGGDTIALAAGSAELVGVDQSPARALMARHNAGVTVEVDDVAGRDVGGWLVHLDPSRRRGGRRLWHYADYQPGPEVIEPLLAAAAGAAVKLGPGIDWNELPGRPARELEFIGDRGGLLQCVMWCGELAAAPGQHAATFLDEPGTRTYSAVPGLLPPVAVGPGRYLFVPAPALERAGLVGARLREIGADGVGELAAGLGILTGDAPLEDPWFHAHEIMARMPWRPRRIKEWLAAHEGGLVTVRTRAAAVDADREQRALRGAGDQEYTVFGLREGKRVVCSIARPVATPH